MVSKIEKFDSHIVPHFDLSSPYQGSVLCRWMGSMCPPYPNNGTAWPSKTTLVPLSHRVVFVGPGEEEQHGPIDLVRVTCLRLGGDHELAGFGVIAGGGKFDRGLYFCALEKIE